MLDLRYVGEKGSLPRTNSQDSQTATRVEVYELYFFFLESRNMPNLGFLGIMFYYVLCLSLLVRSGLSRSTTSCDCCGYWQDCACARSECYDYCGSSNGVDSWRCDEPSWGAWFGGAKVDYSCICESSAPTKPRTPSSSGSSLSDSVGDVIEGASNAANQIANDVYQAVDDFVNGPGDTYRSSADNDFSLTGLVLLQTALAFAL